MKTTAVESIAAITPEAGKPNHHSFPVMSPLIGFLLLLVLLFRSIIERVSFKTNYKSE